jgi:hypothetical protein
MYESEVHSPIIYFIMGTAIRDARRFTLKIRVIPETRYVLVG